MKSSCTFVLTITRDMKNKLNENGKAQILEASILGTEAFKKGLQRAPFFNPELNKFFKNKYIGQTPIGEASSVDIMKAYTNAWDRANIANSWDKLKQA